jgi:hypothetical protein
MYCEEGIGPRSGKRMMALRVHLDEPTVELFMRPIDPQALAAGGQYLLAIADLERASHALSVLMNTTLYYPHPILNSYPGQTVRGVDTVVSHGKATHYHPHSFLLWIDQDRVPHLEMEAPPPHESIEAADWGIGLQGVQVRDGLPRHQAIGEHDRVQQRAFIGIDPDAHLLYLIAWESANAYDMMDSAIAVGVKHGGQLDSGHATHLLLGSDAKGVRPLTGIRGGRPLGPYMGIRAKALE